MQTKRSSSRFQRCEVDLPRMSLLPKAIASLASSTSPRHCQVLTQSTSLSVMSESRNDLNSSLKPDFWKTLNFFCDLEKMIRFRNHKVLWMHIRVEYNFYGKESLILRKYYTQSYNYCINTPIINEYSHILLELQYLFLLANLK